MNRRAFLAVLAGAALDPERLLWVPGRKLISIPPARPIAHEFGLFGFGLDGFPYGPFHVWPSRPAYGDAARILEGLLNHKWCTDSAWRRHANDAIALGLERHLLYEVQIGHLAEVLKT